MADFDDSTSGGFFGDDDMTPAQRMASVISPDVDDSTGPDTPSHPAVASQPPVAPQPTLETSQPSVTDSIPTNVPAGFSPITETNPGTLSPAEQAMQSVGPAPQYDTAKLAALQQEREQESTPTDPNQPQYRPSAWDKVRRGLGAYLTGGLGAAIDTNYSAPNRKYGLAEATRQGKLNTTNQEISDLDKENQEQEKNYTGRLGQTREAITLQKNDDTAAARQETNRVREELGGQMNDIRQQNADLRQQTADNQTPKTYEQAVIARDQARDPAKKAALSKSINTMEQMEAKKFRYAARGNGDEPSSARQSMIDKATNDIQQLQDDWEYNSETNTYESRKTPGKSLTPQEFTDMKNGVSTKLDSQLTAKKMKPLGVRFNQADAQGSQYRNPGRQAAQPSVAAASTVPAATPQPATQNQRPQPVVSQDGLSVSVGGKPYNFKTKEAAQGFLQEITKGQ